MKSIARKSLAGLMVLAMTVLASAQIAPPSKSRLTQRYSRNLGSQRPLPLRTQEPRLPAAASPNIIWVQCPAEAIGLDPAVTCGYLPVPMHRDQPKNPEKIRIYFEVYPHANPGQAVSAILANLGGPGDTTTGLRSLWLAMFAPNMDVHDVLLIDDRGYGMSDTVDCEELQHGTGPSLDQEVADCAAQLDDDASRYSTGDIALDTEAVRAALRYDKVDYYGGSAGGVDVTSYATRFGSHLRSVILDSGGGTPGLIPFGGPYYISLASSRSVRLDCLRSPTCAGDHPNPDTEFEQLIQTVRSQPVQGSAYDANGNLIPVVFDETALFFLIPNPTGNFVGNGELLAAYTSLLQGDAAPLLRLGAEGVIPWVSDFGDPTIFSFGAGGATECVIKGVPYQWSVPPQVRLTQFAEAVSALPPAYFKPFSKAAATAEQVDTDRECLYWEVPSPPTPVVPPGGKYPGVPALVLSSDIDAGVPDEYMRKTAALFPGSTFVIVPEASHEPAANNQCALSLANNLIETLQVGDTSCTKTPETIWPALGRFPLVAADARAAQIDPGGGNRVGLQERKVATVAVATAIDALKRNTIGSGNGVGLRAGTFQTSVDMNGNQTVSLTDCAFATDVTVNGTLTWGSDLSFVADLTVSGTGTAGGTLHVEGTWESPGPVGKFKVSGALGGRQVAVFVPEA
jgi:pimeloyl-ACP methyl ester carboxylesterase